MTNLYVVPFFGVGRRVTLDVSFRYRSSGSSSDIKLLEFDGHLDFDELPEQISKWCSVMHFALRKACEEGITLCGSRHSLPEMIRHAEFIMECVDDGYWERSQSVCDFLEFLSDFSPADC